jgi:glycosyltransferase involved in cell wall biosynthesis
MNKRCGIDGRELVKNQMTGIGRYLSGFLEYAPLLRPDWEFLVFGNQNTSFRGTLPNVKHITISEKSTAFWDQIQLPRYLKKEGVDIFFSPYYKAPIFPPCPTVITIHDITPFIRWSGATDNRRMNIRNIGLKWWSRMLAGKTKSIITVSHYSKKDIVSLFKISEGHISVVYEGVGEEFKPVSRDKIETVKKQYGIGGDYILYVGNFEPHKNVEGIMKSYAKMDSELKKKYRLVIGGKMNGNFTKIKKISAHLGIEKNTVFPGFIDSSNLPALYSGAEIFIFPSFYEGFGLPPLEAMACGTPVISSGRTSLREILDQAAFLIDPEKPDEISGAMKHTLTDGNLHGELKEKGLSRARFFSLKRMSAEILDVLEKTIDS